jgi:hypothetical protein
MTLTNALRFNDRNYSITTHMHNISVEVTATRLLPRLLPLCVEKALNLDQFQTLMRIINDMLKRISTAREQALQDRQYMAQSIADSQSLGGQTSSEAMDLQDLMDKEFAGESSAPSPYPELDGAMQSNALHRNTPTPSPYQPTPAPYSQPLHRYEAAGSSNPYEAQQQQTYSPQQSNSYAEPRPSNPYEEPRRPTLVGQSSNAYEAPRPSNPYEDASPFATHQKTNAPGRPFSSQGACVCIWMWVPVCVYLSLRLFVSESEKTHMLW